MQTLDLGKAMRIAPSNVSSARRIDKVIVESFSHSLHCSRGTGLWLLMMLLLLLRHVLACPLPKQGGHCHHLRGPSKGPTQAGGHPSLV
jgi:hypothetical protein